MRRDLYGPDRGLRRGRGLLRHPGRRRRARGLGGPPQVRGRQGRRVERGEGRGVPERDARRRRGLKVPRELGIGTNYGIPRATKNILFDEKLGGTIHLAVGRSYEKTGGKNDSSVHWDLICDLREGGELYADGEPIEKDGEFVGYDFR
ncbi:hypothetical protein GBA65_12250 [Rubrobacter marinus]|uniref:Aminopeptidase n=1 Tax=Rubrobacter marinus TaxID=2653852 RepID=A0A6G8PYC5_9ACTN|nr:hypothetical protein GBA65_12250 [Rubrobacter marinus]